MAGNETLSARNRAALDEWYTQLTDIEAELRHYRDQFKGKVVFCNCDDPYESNFFKFFAMSFNHLGLKRLITTCYAGSPISGEQLPLFETAGLRETQPPREPYKVVSRPGESHPRALAELYVNVSAHTAPIIQPPASPPADANGRTAGARDEQGHRANGWLDGDVAVASCISAWPIEPTGH